MVTKILRVSGTRYFTTLTQKRDHRRSGVNYAMGLCSARAYTSTDAQIRINPGIAGTTIPTEPAAMAMATRASPRGSLSAMEAGRVIDSRANDAEPKSPGIGLPNLTAESDGKSE